MRIGLGAIALGPLLVLVHWYLATQPPNIASPLTPLDRLFDVGLVGAIVIFAFGLGRAIFARARWNADSPMEQAVFAFGIGMGAISLLLVLLGFLGWLDATIVLIGLIAGIMLTHREWRALFDALYQSWLTRAPFTRVERGMLIVTALLILPVMLISLTPPSDADALAYHVVAPLMFLTKRAIFPVLTNVGVNYPLGVDLLYAIAFAAGSDTAAGLIHFTFGLAATAGIYVFAAKNFSRQIGLLAMVIFWTSPVVGAVAGSPIIDMGWAFYELLALLAFFRWRAAHQNFDLILIGASIGFALSNKYLAGIGAGFVGILVLIESIRAFRARPRAWIAHALLYGLTAFVIASPWYLKNWIWFGNPAYPFFFGAYGLDGVLHKPTGGETLQDWVGMGTGHDWLALLRFPFDVYVRWQAYGGANRGGPSLFFLMLPVYLVLPKHKMINGLFLICAVRFAVWWEYAQNMRYLVVIFPWLSIIVAYTVATFAARLPRPSLRAAFATLLVLFCAFGLFLQWGFLLFLNDDVLRLHAGLIAREKFLEANLISYRSTRFINEQLPDNVLILGIGEKRAYYIRRPLIPDDGHARWLELIATNGTPAGVARQLRDLGVTHVWLSEDDLKYVRNYWKVGTPLDDPALGFDEFRARYLRAIYADANGHTVFEFHPTGATP
jgi:4-amino-4-deoxy-L-arabinose transferase-like glycosyltransferase